MPQAALIELLARVGARNGAAVLISDEELSQWPATAVAAMKSQRLLAKARPASSTICPGCERACVMPVHTVPPRASGAAASFVVCDKRSDINRVPVSAKQLRQWRCDADAVCGFVAASLGLRRSDHHTADAGSLNIGIASGGKRKCMLSDRARARDEMSKILVTGGSGFVGSHCILQLLHQGHKVRTTVRSLDRERDVRAMLKEGGIEPADRLSFVTADLNLDTNWAEVTKGCDFVLHVASPFPPASPKSEDEVIVPARDGALRVLRAARDAGVKRVVLTSSFAAIGYGHTPQTAPFDETSWTELRADLSAYVKSKTIAERAAWDFVAKKDGGLELSVVNPVGIFEPVLGPDYSTSIHIIRRLMEGAIPGCPRLYFGMVDVRDVADLHLRAMTTPAAKGERFLAVAGECVSMFEVAKVLAAAAAPGDGGAAAPGGGGGGGGRRGRRRCRRAWRIRTRRPWRWQPRRSRQRRQRWRPAG
jgi:nucleoside-diphosphate-sugar epimerase